MVRLGGDARWLDIVYMRDDARNVTAILNKRGRPSDRDPHEIAASGIVLLVRELGRAGDSSAVAVMFDGQRVGYLSKRDAAPIAPALDSLHTAGQVASTGARIMRHLDHHPERIRSGTQNEIEDALPEFTGVVTVAPPEDWFPVNPRPTGAVHRLEFSSSAAVASSDEHQPYLDQLAAAGRNPYYWATLKTSVTPTGRIDIEVLVDGVTIGKLGPTLLKEVGHVVVDKSSEGLVVGVTAHMARSKGKVNARLAMAR